MAGDLDMPELFSELLDCAAPAGGGVPLGRARLREPVRDQVEMRLCDLDALISADHPARMFWTYACKVDFSAFEASVKSRDGVAGMPQTSPQLLLALWLCATARGIGSARELARLCERETEFRWLCGDVSVNHRILSQFRTSQGARIGDLLARHVASLSLAGLINLDEIAQDGVRIRASAGAASFRRRKTLESELVKAQDVVAKLAKQEGEDPGTPGKRIKAARERAAKEREARVACALEALGKAEKLREKRLKTNKAQAQKQKEPRASTTDPEARVMKMADGGFRPAYNVQFASLPENGIIVAVGNETSGSDRGLAEPMAQKVEDAYGERPKTHLADGGYSCAGDIEAAAAAGTVLVCPAIKSKSGRDAHEPRDEDSKPVAQWRALMGSDAGKAIYQRRSRCELVHARLRNLHLDRLLLRGKEKVTIWMTWFALAGNLVTEARLVEEKRLKAA